MKISPKVFAILLILPTFFFGLSISNLLKTSGVYLYSGFGVHQRAALLTGQPTIDPNYGFTSEALGVRAAQEVLSGQLPLWNFYEGFGAPLLGEMQSAALFPFTWLQALPNGQVLEEALLQVLAGFGTFLFLRKLGLSVRAAVIASLLFEVNGVFGWLRNAVYNPVAFLPWLFFIIESLYDSNIRQRSYSERFHWIALGGLISALAVFAGFPEEVYLYSLFILAWIAFRFACLCGKSKLKFAADIACFSVLGVLISLPILLAFLQYLPQAIIGGHTGDGLYGIFLPTPALIQYLLPYVYGPIFAAHSPEISAIWGSTGGYLGLAPFLCGTMALQFPERRTIKFILLSWIVIALGVSHGLSGVYEIFMFLPLAKITACYRYLNASWIFAFTVLVGLLLDELPRAGSKQTRAALLISAGVVFVTVVVCAILANSALFGNLTQSPIGQASAVLSVIAFATVIACAVKLASLTENMKIVINALSSLVVVEAIANFTVPYLSYPRGGKIDLAAIEYLRQNSGFQRVVGTESGQMAANYGSYFGVSQINWNDLPVPRIAFDYVRDHLDPYVKDPILYLPDPIGLSNADQTKRKTVFARNLSNYARAGVKYVLSSDHPGAVSPYPLRLDDRYPLNLEAGQYIAMTLPAPFVGGGTISSLSVLIGTYQGKTQGRLLAELCRGETCVHGVTDLETAIDNRPVEIDLDQPLFVGPTDILKLTIRKDGGDHGVALWMGVLVSRPNVLDVFSDSASFRPKSAPLIAFVEAARSNVRFVYHGQTTNIYELKDVRPYFDAAECSLAPMSRNEVEASCPVAARLTRLELAMAGWKVHVNGAEADIRLVDDAFQQVDLPKGSSRVRFSFMPTGMRPALFISALVLLCVLFALSKAIWNWARRVIPAHSPQTWEH